MEKLQPPEKISSQMICIKTHYDKMSAEERKVTFDSYDYNRRDRAYYLRKKNNLTEPIIRKLK